MIEEYSLQNLCKKYNLNFEKIVNKNNNILNYGEYKEIDETLNYLINKINISTRNIEKCPSILYLNVHEIEKNVNFLKSKEIMFGNVENCLHVLSTENEKLKETYEYVINNYGKKALNDLTSILSVNINIIKAVEELNIEFKEKRDNLLIASSIEFGIQTLDNIKKILNSEEFRQYPYLFTSTILANAKIEEIKNIIHSEEFKQYPHLFTSTTLAYAKIEEIKNIIHSEEFKQYPHLFTSTTLAKAKIEDIRKLLNQPYWNDEIMKKIISPTFVSKSRKMIEKIPILIKIAKEHNIYEYINKSFFIKSPSQNYALIMYLQSKNYPLVVNNKLNLIFNYSPEALKKKYNIDIKLLMELYPYDNKEKGNIKK